MPAVARRAERRVHSSVELARRPFRTTFGAAICAIYVAILAPFSTRAEMYDLSLPAKVPPQSCTHGCARWRSLEADGSPQPQHAADAMWKHGPPGERVAVVCLTKWVRLCSVRYTHCAVGCVVLCQLAMAARCQAGRCSAATCTTRRSRGSGRTVAQSGSWCPLQVRCSAG